MNQQTQNKEQAGKGSTETKNQPNKPTQPEYKDKPMPTTQDAQNAQSKDKSCGDDVTSRPRSAQGQDISTGVKEEGGIKEWSEAGLPTDK